MKRKRKDISKFLENSSRDFGKFDILNHMKKVTLKTSRDKTSYAQYLKSLTSEEKKQAKFLCEVFEKATGVKPKVWGENIVGFGEYTYYRSNGAQGDFLATGFAIRKSGPMLYVMPGYTDHSELIEKAGLKQKGKSCLSAKDLNEVHIPSLKKLIKTGIKDLKIDHEVRMK